MARAVGVGAGEQREYVGAGAEGAAVEAQALSTATSELVRNILKYAGSGELRDRDGAARAVAKLFEDIPTNRAAILLAERARHDRSAHIAKEMLDAHGGSGFSFADMAANRAGVAGQEECQCHGYRT